MYADRSEGDRCLIVPLNNLLLRADDDKVRAAAEMGRQAVLQGWCL